MKYEGYLNIIEEEYNGFESIERAITGEAFCDILEIMKLPGEFQGTIKVKYEYIPSKTDEIPMSLLDKEQMIKLLQIPLGPGESPAGRLEMILGLVIDPKEIEDED